jgi:hypothetical protein
VEGALVDFLEGRVRGGGGFEDDAATHNVGLAAEGLGKGGDDGVSGWKHVDIGEAVDGVVYEYKKSYWLACLACKHIFAQRSIHCILTAPRPKPAPRLLGTPGHTWSLDLGRPCRGLLKVLSDSEFLIQLKSKRNPTN